MPCLACRGQDSHCPLARLFADDDLTGSLYGYVPVDVPLSEDTASFWMSAVEHACTWASSSPAIGWFSVSSPSALASVMEVNDIVPRDCAAALSLLCDSGKLRRVDGGDVRGLRAPATRVGIGWLSSVWGAASVPASWALNSLLGRRSDAADGPAGAAHALEGVVLLHPVLLERSMDAVCAQVQLLPPPHVYTLAADVQQEDSSVRVVTAFWTVAARCRGLARLGRVELGVLADQLVARGRARVVHVDGQDVLLFCVAPPVESEVATAGACLRLRLVEAALDHKVAVCSAEVCSRRSCTSRCVYAAAAVGVAPLAL